MERHITQKPTMAGKRSCDVERTRAWSLTRCVAKWTTGGICSLASSQALHTPPADGSLAMLYVSQLIEPEGFQRG